VLTMKPYVAVPSKTVGCATDRREWGVTPQPDSKALSFRDLLLGGRWFKDIPETFRAALLAHARVRSLAPGDRLFARGDAPSGLYAVVTGAVRITATTENGREALLTLALPPTWFGEIAIFDGLPRTHDALVDEATTVVHVPHEKMLLLLDEDPTRWRDLALLLTTKLRLALSALEESATMPLAQRLARRLVLMAESYGEWSDRSARVLDVRQEQLAAMLSSSRQTVNQVLKGLEANGLIRLAYGKVEIVDLEGLKGAAIGR